MMTSFKKTFIFVTISLMISNIVTLDALQKQIDKLQVDLKAENQEAIKNGRRLIKESPISLKDKFSCVGGVDPKKMTNAEYLAAFRKGSCTPAVFIPGIGGSKLTVHIDCQVLQEKNNEIFQMCGWDSCDKNNFLDALHPDETLMKASVPKESYILWVPDLIGPLSLIHQIQPNPYGKTEFDTCFSKVFGLKTIKDS